MPLIRGRRWIRSELHRFGHEVAELTVAKYMVRGMGIEEVLIAPRSPWQSPYVERLIGSIRRECLDHILVINEGHLQRVLREYFAYYHDSRPHQSLDGNARSSAGAATAIEEHSITWRSFHLSARR